MCGRADDDVLIKAVVKLVLCCCGRFIPGEAMSHKKVVTLICHEQSW